MEANWIYVTERLPEENKNVMITINYDDVLHIAYIKNGNWHLWIDGDLGIGGECRIKTGLRFHNVIAWAEIPKHAEWN